VVKRIAVGAHYGLKDWLVQRLTGVLMVVYTLGLLAVLLNLPADHAGWRALFATLPMKVFTSVTLLGLIWHVWIGVRDILMDYLWKLPVRLAAMFLVVLFLAGNTVWAFNIVWSVN
jgi:succinate dehydrogenase / fumarate reductase, membrane anchor subunit